MGTEKARTHVTIINIKRYGTTLPSTNVESRLVKCIYSEIYCNSENYPQNNLLQTIELEPSFINKPINNGIEDLFICQGLYIKKNIKTQHIDN